MAKGQGTVYVVKNGKAEIARGPQPKDALLFIPSGKSLVQRIEEQRQRALQNIRFIRSRVEAARRS